MHYLRMMLFRKHYRFSDVVAGVCIPCSLLLTIYVSQLSKDLQEIAVATQINEFSSRRSFGDSKFLQQTRQKLEAIPINLVDNDQIKVAPPLNNSGKGTEDILILTSISRSGQSTIRTLMKKLRRKNHFQIISPPLKKEKVIELPSEEKQRTVVEKVATINETSAIIDHFAFIDFEKFGGKQPIQVSMVRDPVERAISLYYYARAPYRVVEQQQRFPDENLPTRQFLRKSMESCINNSEDLECNFAKNSERIGHTIHYFCGHDHFCKKFANEESLELAKSNVEKNFAVVGVLEDLNKTLIVLEHYIPKFFKGATKTYHEKLQRNDMRTIFNTNIYKPNVDEIYKKILHRDFEIERNFYEFIRERLDKQYRKILERSKISERLKLENYAGLGT